MTLTFLWCSCIPREISSTVWLISRNQIASNFHIKMFWLLPLHYITAMQIPNRTRSEAMYNVSAPQLPLHYQPQRVPTTSWTDSFTSYTRRKQARAKILQNFCLIPVDMFILITVNTNLEQQNNKQKLQILEALHIRNIRPKLNRINFETSANVLKCI